MASNPQPLEPVCALGYPAEQVRGLIGAERMNQFSDFMLMRAHAACNGGSPCNEAHGNVFYPPDVLQFIGQHVQRSAAPMRQHDLDAIYDAWDRMRRTPTIGE